MAIVGPQFCAPYPVDLIITQKFLSISERDFTVRDVQDNVWFRVKKTVFSLRERRVLQDASGQPVLTMQKKVLTAHDKWKVYRGSSTDDKDLLFVAKRSHMLQLKTSLDVFLAANTSKNVPDFKVKGSFFERSCSVYVGDTSSIVAQMKKQYTLKNIALGKDSFGVTIYPNVDQAFIVALIIVLDEINKEGGGSGGSFDVEI
ncbi:protein LURP-one-related 15-like [Wolffia australiana]